MARVSGDLFVGQLREFGGDFFKNGWHGFLLVGRPPPPSLFAQNLQKIEVRVGSKWAANLQSLQNKGHRVTLGCKIFIPKSFGRRREDRRAPQAASGYTLILSVASSDVPFSPFTWMREGARRFVADHTRCKYGGPSPTAQDDGSFEFWGGAQKLRVVLASSDNNRQRGDNSRQRWRG